MKKFISFVMAAAMVASMVPATAFAGDRTTATAKIIGSVKMSSDEAKGDENRKSGTYKLSDAATVEGRAEQAPELVLKLTGVSYEATTGKTFTQDIKLLLDNADFADWDAWTDDYYKNGNVLTGDVHPYISIKDKDDNVLNGLLSDASKLSDARSNNFFTTAQVPYVSAVKRVGADELKITITGKFEQGDTVKIDLVSRLTTTAAGKTATVSVSGDLVSNDDLVYATIVKKGLTVSIKDTVDVAQEEKVELNSKGLKIKFTEGTYDSSKEVVVKLNKGFEFETRTDLKFYDKKDNLISMTYTDADRDKLSAGYYTYDDDELIFRLPDSGASRTKPTEPTTEKYVQPAAPELVDTASDIKAKIDALPTIGDKPVESTFLAAADVDAKKQAYDDEKTIYDPLKEAYDTAVSNEATINATEATKASELATAQATEATAKAAFVDDSSNAALEKAYEEAKAATAEAKTAYDTAAQAKVDNDAALAKGDPSSKKMDDAKKAWENAVSDADKAYRLALEKFNADNHEYNKLEKEYNAALEADKVANAPIVEQYEKDLAAWKAVEDAWAKYYTDLANYNAGVVHDFKELTIKELEIEATSAKVGAEATITVKHNSVSDSCVVAQVVDYKVKMTVDADEDVPVIYSGVNVKNYGITDDSDHWSLEVTAEETFPGAWGMRKEFSMYLPAGVYVTDVKVKDTENFLDSSKTSAKEDADEVDPAAWEKAFKDAYQDGNHVTFEFPKRLFDDVDAKLTDDPAYVTFELQLVADPTFEGDVVLTLEGELIDKNEVTIAKFVKPYTTTAQTNDMIIDYRYTDIETDITITEAADGLWAKNEAEFQFAVEKGIEFENDADFTVTEDSGLELKSTGSKNSDVAKFTVKSESDDAATVTINNASLYMERNIPAGPYDLLLRSSLADAYVKQGLFAPDDDKVIADVTDYTFYDADKDNAYTVKEGFVNVITSGRDTDDASFTTKVVVPVGEKYLIAGDRQIELDVPAYITAAGYTMLPVRAVANALGINSDAVMWNGDARTVTIFYGQRIITMTIGQKVVNVNGSAIPASAEVEITDGRTFLPMRDLATALGVTDITWDSASKTATLNGNQVTAK